MTGPRILGLLLFILTAGCVGTEDVPTRELQQPKETPPVPRSLSKVPASPALAEPPKGKTPDAQRPGKPEVSPPLDLVSLENRLRESKAIGIFTKISLKNQVGDLVDQLRAFHQGRAGPGLPELRERYNLLLLKVLSLLQDSDPLLARAIAASREPLWSLLANPAKFATL